MYQPVDRRAAGGHMGRLRQTFFPTNEERYHLLTDRHPL